MGKQHHLLAAAALGLGRLLYAQAEPGCPTQPATLKAMRNCFRPVLVFAPGARDASFVAQQKMLEQYADDMMDRNLLYVPVLGQRGRFESPLDAPYVRLSQAEMDATRSRFQVEAGQFTLVLVGKDGGEKFRSRRPISVLKLDELVDAMPMGAQEKNARGRKTP